MLRLLFAPLLMVALGSPAMAVPTWKDVALARVKVLETKFVGLAEATPADKFTYRPEKGVRSVSEVFLHVSGANFGLPRSLGTQPPAGADD